MSERLSVRGLRKAFGATQALGGVDFSARPGEVHAVIGENGAGKSTLMHVLAGSLVADSGSLTLDGAPFTPHSPADARARGVALVSQELSVCPQLSVLENVMLGQEIARFGFIDVQAMKRAVVAALSPLCGADAARWVETKRLISELSLPSQQLVEIGRALVERGRCKVLILDEPTSSLGREDTARLFEVIRRVAQDGVTVLYISHFLEEVKQLADRFTVLRDGLTVGSGNVASTDTSEMVRMMAGRRVEQLFVRSPHTPGDPVLEVTALAGVALPRDATLMLRAGEVLGIAGLVGAGRTELLRAIFGLERVRSGQVKVKAFVGPASPARRLRQGVGLLSEDRKGEGLALGMSVADNLTLSRLPATQWGFLGPRAQGRVAATWITRLGVKTAGPWQPVHSLSGGNQQKVALGRLLHHDVDVLLLDEPTRGVDVGSKAQIYERIDELGRAGKAVLMVSSYLPELLGVCDRIAVMHRGKLSEPVPASQCTEQSLLELATGAEAAS